MFDLGPLNEGLDGEDDSMRCDGDVTRGSPSFWRGERHRQAARHGSPHLIGHVRVRDDVADAVQEGRIRVLPASHADTRHVCLPTYVQEILII